MKFTLAAIALLAFAIPTHAQVTYPPADATVAVTQATTAAQTAQQALQAANAAQATANAAVRSVGGSPPDTSGNVGLPNAFTNATCTSCVMAGTSLTGATTLNGTPVATSADIATNTTNWRAAINTALAGIPSSVNGQIGVVTVPVYTDAMAVSANAASITSATNLAKAAAADSIQIATPASGGTVAASAGTNVLFINNAALLASLTIVYPPSPTDGQRFTVAANNTVTTLGFSGATSRGAASTLSASGYARFVWSASLGLWFRVG